MSWEYLVQTFDSTSVFLEGESSARKLQGFLNDRGADGWELVSTLETADGWLVLSFKRPTAGVAARR